METSIYQNLRRFINVVDELRDVGLQQYINLPRICVIGTQSAGKSSVLEAIVGLDFLPRGDGVVTRRPLELRLVHLAESGAEAAARAEFDIDNMNKLVFTDFNQVQKTIVQLTDEVAGSNKGISEDPIILTVYGHKCPDLTLIDLPGITRVPLKGSDQTDDIERLTRDMALRYARDNRTIILAVIPANVDISTADALQLARRVDPKGSRTIGVITKIDLMDRGTDATTMLMGDEVPLRLGYTGVRNRSQMDINEGKSVAAALEDERLFFQNHPSYSKLPSSVLGTRALVEKLTHVLFRHIKSVLPDIQREINARLRATTLRLEELGDGVPTEPSELVQLMWRVISDYCEIYKNTIRGKYDKRLITYYDHFNNDSSALGQSDFTGGAQIRLIFNELLEDFVDADVTADMTDQDIDTAIRMHEGDSLPGFPSPDTFEYLILPHLRKIHAPAMECLERVAQALELLSNKIVNRIFTRFPRLAEEVLDLSQEILSREKDATKQVLENMISSETGYLFTNDSSYLSNHGTMIRLGDTKGHDSAANTDTGGQGIEPAQPLLTNASTAAPTSNSQNVLGQTKAADRATRLLGSMQQSVNNLWSSGGEKKPNKQKSTGYSGPFIQEIRRRLDAYFAIVLRNVRDMVPKAIGFFLVRQLQDKLQFELYNHVNRAEKMEALLGEPPKIVAERKKLQEQLQTLKKSVLVLQRDADLNSAKLSLDHEDFPFGNVAPPNMATGTLSKGGVFDECPIQKTTTTSVPNAMGHQTAGHTMYTAGAIRHQQDGGTSTAVSAPSKSHSESRKGALFVDKQQSTSGGKPLFEIKEQKRQVPNNPLFG